MKDNQTAESLSRLENEYLQSCRDQVCELIELIDILEQTDDLEIIKSSLATIEQAEKDIDSKFNIAKEIKKYKTNKFQK